MSEHLSAHQSIPEPVLLTGASGFVGRHVLRRLADVGAEVHATTRRPPDDPSHGAPLPGGATWHRLDLADADAVDVLVEEVRPAVVLHLASHVAGAREVELVRPTFEGNLASAVHLLTAVERAGSCRRFVQVGSLEEPPGPEVAPSSPYAAAKAAAASYGRMFHHLYGTPVTFARVFMVYGEGPQDERKLVPYTIRSLLALRDGEGDEPSFSSGTRPVDWIHVADVAEGLVRLATAEGVEGRTVDLGSGTLHTVRRVVEAIYRRLAPGVAPELGARGDRKDEQVRRADVDATEALLGWRPALGLEAGLDRTIEWFETHRGR